MKARMKHEEDEETLRTKSVPFMYQYEPDCMAWEIEKHGLRLRSISVVFCIVRVFHNTRLL